MNNNSKEEFIAIENEVEEDPAVVKMKRGPKSMESERVDFFAENLGKSRSEYLELTRSILSGKDESTEFILKDCKLRWKKGRWIYGEIEMSDSIIEQEFSDVAKRLALRHSDIEKTVDEIKAENKELRIRQKGLNDKLDKMITAKNKLEENLYKKFIVVLNSKKEKIRELQNELVKSNGIDRSKGEKIYEAETDHSEEEEDDDKDGKRENDGNEKSKKEETRVEPSMFLSRAFNNVDIIEEDKLLKRQLSDSEGKMIDSDYEEYEKSKRIGNKQAKGSGRKTKQSKNKRSKIVESTPPRASTSKNILGIDRGEEKVTPNSKKPLNFDVRESDEDIFSDN